MPERSPPLWDLPTRALHWGLAAAVIVCLTTAWLMPAPYMIVHYWSGAVAAALLVSRVIWGVFGSGHARFSRFPLTPSQVRAHWSVVTRGGAGHWDGHPPLGALMAVLLWAGVAALVVTGVVGLGGQEKLGPLAAVVSFGLGHDLIELHEVLGLLIALAVGGHLVGVAVESRLMGENLGRSMITGRRKKDTSGPLEPARMVPAALLGLLVVGGGAGTAVALSGLPAPDTRTLARPAAYAEDCGACHTAYHPSVLTAAGWTRVMGDLEDHFGENASLDPETTATLTAWLTRNAAETWDTKAAALARRLPADAPPALSRGETWKHIHEDLDAAVFDLRAVGSKANCSACHQDAVTGLYRRDAIHLPEGVDS